MCLYLLVNFRGKMQKCQTKMKKIVVFGLAVS